MKEIRIALMLLISMCFMLSCTNNKEDREQQEIVVPPPKQPILQSGKSVSTKIDQNIDYSPGNIEWKLPTEEEQDEWDHDVYVKALHTWAKPHLAHWYCQTCKAELNKDFRFFERNGDSIKFKCKCNCGHEHTITLQDGESYRGLFRSQK